MSREGTLLYKGTADVRLHCTTQDSFIWVTIIRIKIFLDRYCLFEVWFHADLSNSRFIGQLYFFNP